MLAFGIAMLLATPWGGVAADRFPKRSVLLVAVTILIVSSLFVGLAVVTDVIEYWMLLLASALQAAAFALYLPARIALIAEVVEHDQIGEAVVLSQTAQEAMRVIAPALAGVLIGLSWFGVGGVFLLAAGTSTLGAVVLFGLPAGAPALDANPIADRRDGRRLPVRALPARARAGGLDDDRRRRHRLPVPDVPADARRRALRRRRRRLRRDGGRRRPRCRHRRAHRAAHELDRAAPVAHHRRRRYGARRVAHRPRRRRVVLDRPRRPRSPSVRPGWSSRPRRSR